MKQYLMMVKECDIEVLSRVFPWVQFLEAQGMPTQNHLMLATPIVHPVPVIQAENSSQPMVESAQPEQSSNAEVMDTIIQDGN